MIIKLSGINKFNGESLENHIIHKTNNGQWYYNDEPLSENDVLSLLKVHDNKEFNNIISY